MARMIAHTTRRGRVRSTSRKQVRFLFAKKLPFTGIMKSKKGKIYRKRFNA